MHTITADNGRLISITRDDFWTADAVRYTTSPLCYHVTICGPISPRKADTFDGWMTRDTLDDMVTDLAGILDRLAR